jgi:hypothetical protein
MTNKKKINQESQLIFSIANPIPYKKTMATYWWPNVYLLIWSSCTPALLDISKVWVFFKKAITHLRICNRTQTTNTNLKKQFLPFGLPFLAPLIFQNQYFELN